MLRSSTRNVSSPLGDRFTWPSPLSGALATNHTGWAGIHDSLFGFRVYPIADLLAVMEGRRSMRRFDFDPEAAVRLVWRGVAPVNLPAPVRYLSAAEGGVSHFKYVRDNALLTAMHTRLMLAAIARLPGVMARRLRPPAAPPP